MFSGSLRMAAWFTRATPTRRDAQRRSTPTTATSPCNYSGKFKYKYKYKYMVHHKHKSTNVEGRTEEKQRYCTYISILLYWQIQIRIIPIQIPNNLVAQRTSIPSNATNPCQQSLNVVYWYWKQRQSVQTWSLLGSTQKIASQASLFAVIFSLLLN